MTFCFCIDDDTHVVVHDDVIHRDYSRVINKCGKKEEEVLTRHLVMVENQEQCTKDTPHFVV